MKFGHNFLHDQELAQLNLLMNVSIMDIIFGSQHYTFALTSAIEGKHSSMESFTHYLTISHQWYYLIPKKYLSHDCHMSNLIEIQMLGSIQCSPSTFCWDDHCPITFLKILKVCDIRANQENTEKVFRMYS